MAESKHFNKTLTKGSDILPDIYCDPCHDLEGEVLQAAGFCENCSENLCLECVSAHKRNKFTRNHKIQDQAGVQSKSSIQGTKPVTAKCNQHEEEVLRSYCSSCDQLCCNICQTVDHQTCIMQSLTNAAASIKDSQQLKDIEKKLKVVKMGYNDNLSKAENQSANIEKFYTDTINEMRKLQEKFEKVFAETVKRVEMAKDGDLMKTESISKTCNILVEQINKISSNLDQMQDNTNNETLFISAKRAEIQLKSFEDRLNQLDKDNTIQLYKFEPNKKLNAMLDELKTLGEISFSNSTSHVPMMKTPDFIKDIDTQSPNIRGSILLPDQRLLLTNMNSCKVKLIDTKQNKIVSQLKLPDCLWDLTQLKVGKFAITIVNLKKIQFVSLSSDKLSKDRVMSVNGKCLGLEYNEQQDNLIVTYFDPSKVEILSLTGTVIKRFVRDANGVQLFSISKYVALSHDKTIIYVTDTNQQSVTSMTLNGDVIAVYKDDTLQGPGGICVNKSGIVYVVGSESNTVHQIVPGSGKLEPLMDHKNGINNPITINYCDTDDKLFVGQTDKGIKIFKMK